MTKDKTYLISASGQVSVPAAFRRRWGLEYGGPIEIIDVGDALILAPKPGLERMLDRALSADDHLEFVRRLDDPDLATT